MTEDLLRKESLRFSQVLPVYLGVQGITLLLTYLETPVYLEAYGRQHSLTVSGWVGAWFILVLIGLATGLILLIRKAWRTVLDEETRVKLAGGYLLGGIAGLLTLGLRFMAIMPPAYFAVTGGLAVLLVVSYLVWNRRQPSTDEMFP